jgi:hypothetical protein
MNQIRETANTPSIDHRATTTVAAGSGADGDDVGRDGQKGLNRIEVKRSRHGDELAEAVNSIDQLANLRQVQPVQ